MAIAYDTSVNAGFSGSASLTKTWSHTCTGDDRLLFVNVGTGGDSVTGVTYNGVSMTKITSYANDGSLYTSMWYLINPASGANNVVVTCSSSVNIIPHSISYTGCDQSSQPDVYNTTNTTSNTITATVTTTVDNDWLMMYVRKSAGGSMTAGSGTVSRQNDSTYGYHTLDSNSAITPAGSASLIGSHTSSTKYAIIVGFKPVGVASTFKPIVTSFM